MNDHQLESGLGTALREYADDIHPDLDALVRTSRTAGARIRARRRLGVSLAAAATVAGIVGAATLGGQLGDRAASDPGFATQPASPTSTTPFVGQVIHFDHGTRGKIYRCGDRKPDCAVPSVPALVLMPKHQGSASGFVVVVESWPGSRAAQERALAGLDRRYPGIAMAMPLSPAQVFGRASATGASNDFYRGQDVTIHVADWKLVGTVGDDKQSLEGPGGAVADIVWRPASDHDAWAASPDKGNAPGVWTSEVHDGVFVSIQGGSGTTDADIQALGASLTWD